MKKILLLISIIFLSCTTRRLNISPSGNNQEKANLVTPAFEKIDPGLARVLKNEDLRYSTAKVPQPNKYDTVLKINTGNIFIINKKGDTIKNYDYEPNEKGGYILLEHVPPYLRVEKYYYSNGNIRSKNIGSWLGFTIGKSYVFDENGVVKEMVDHDIGYKFVFDDVVKFCNKHKVSLIWDPERGHNWITKKLYHLEPAWYITGYPDKETQKFEIVILDGKNGKILGKQKPPVIIE